MALAANSEVTLNDYRYPKWAHIVIKYLIKS